MAAYGLWRLSDAAFGIENPGSDGRALRKRAAAGGIGLIYLYLCYKAVRILLAGHAGTMTPHEQADTVLDLPGGSIILGCAALFLAVAGVVQIRKSGKCTFLHRLDERAQAPDLRLREDAENVPVKQLQIGAEREVLARGTVGEA